MDTLPPLFLRKHADILLWGIQFFKAAINANDFSASFTRNFNFVSINAPWVANIWNNMALAEEAACKYDFATNCFQVYQDFKLSDADAQEAQDKVYEIQAKQKMQAEKQAADQQAAAAEQRATEAFEAYKDKVGNGIYYRWYASVNEKYDYDGPGSGATTEELYQHGVVRKWLNPEVQYVFEGEKVLICSAHSGTVDRKKIFLRGAPDKSGNINLGSSIG